MGQTEGLEVLDGSLAAAAVVVDSLASNIPAEAESTSLKAEPQDEELVVSKSGEDPNSVMAPSQEEPVAEEMEGGLQSAQLKGLRMNARFVADMSIPDGTRLPPSAEFTKIWSLENVGDTIPAGTRVVFVGGETFSHEAVDCQIREDVAADKKFLVTLGGLRAPSGAGRTYTGFWRLTDREGQVFGDRLWIE